MFILIFSIVTVVGFMTVDVGLWLSERRGAQTDADLPALAGARECLLNLVSDGEYNPDVTGAVQNWLAKNNGGEPVSECGDPNAQDDQLCFDADQTSTECERQDNGQRCVDVVVKHRSRNMFSALPFFNHVFDDTAGTVGAHARACAGGAQNPGNVIPIDTYAICQEADPPEAGPCFNADGTPKLGEPCGLEFGAQSGTACNNPRGQLDLWAGGEQCSNSQGPANVEDLIRDGAPGICLLNDTGSCTDWFDCAETVTGNAQNVLDGINARVTQNHMCDDNFPDSGGVSNVDDLSEAVFLQDGVYEARDCDPDQSGLQMSERLASIIVFDEYPDEPNTPYPISAFGAFYIKGCTTTVADCTDPNYGWSLNELNCNMHGQIGHAVVCGQFLRVILSGTGIGGVNDTTTEFGIALCDWESGEGCGGGSGGTPGPTDTPAPTPEPPTPCPTVCNPGGQQCQPSCPVPTDTPRPPTATPVPTATRTPVPTATHTPVPTATHTPAPPTATPTICIKPNGKPC
jgi:hypothetical protein